ncbi:MAG: GldG family protein [Candidatus Sumerlaeota bacterium]|nr:GldG family protein [Candidatus Sumerlaeota bacterium]
MFPIKPPIALPASQAARNKAFAFVGLVLFFTGLVVTALNGFFTLLSSVLCVMGALVGCAIFLPRLTRNASLYLKMILYSLFAAGTLIMLFLVIQRRPVQYDATKGKIYSVSDITRSFLRRLDRPVRATAFVTETEKDDAVRLFNEYERYSPRFSYQVINPFREPAAARRYGLNVMPGDIYLETLTTDTLSADNAVKVSKLNEEEMTNGIIQLLRGRQLVLYFLTGHGELAIEKDEASALMAGRRATTDNIVWLAEQLKRAYIKALSLPLAQRGRVPADASAVICAAPKTDISGAEREALAAYLESGGKAIFLLNPELSQLGRELRTPLRNIANLLEDYGIVLPQDILVVAQSAQGDSADFRIPIKPLKHRIAQISGGEPLVFGNVRPVLPASARPGNLLIEPFLESAVNTMRLPTEEVANAYLNRRKLELKMKDVEAGIQPVGLTASLQPPGMGEDRATRIVTIGCGNFISTELITQKGWLIFQNSLNWLTNSGDLIAIPAAEIENTPIILTAGQKQFLFLLLVIIVPALVGLCGLGYCMMRRGN